MNPNHISMRMSAQSDEDSLVTDAEYRYCNCGTLAATREALPRYAT